MDASVQAVYGEIVLKFKKFLVEEGGNDNILYVPQNFINKCSGIVGEGHGYGPVVHTRGNPYILVTFLGI